MTVQRYTALPILKNISTCFFDVNGFLDMRQFFNVSVNVWSYYSNRYCLLYKEWEDEG